jgi:hypothetical protein
VALGLVIGAGIVWRTAPDDGRDTTAAPAVAEHLSWALYAPDGQGFRAEYPAPPVVDDGSSEGDGRPQARYAALVNQQLYAVVVADTGDERLESGMTDDEARHALDGYLGRSARASGAQVDSSVPTRVSAAPALDYELATDATRTKGKAVLVGRRVFDVRVSAADLQADPADHFLQSFSLQ